MTWTCRLTSRKWPTGWTTIRSRTSAISSMLVSAREIMLALQRSAAEGGQVALPLTSGVDEQALLKIQARGPRRARLLRAESKRIWAGLIFSRVGSA